MKTRRTDRISGGIGILFGVGAVGDLTDGQLLERFAAGGEAADLAFAALIERHGPLVQRTCRSILGDEHEAQDATQATFLILVRKAGSLRVEDSVGPWLHQVACRAARSSRSAAGRRATLERKAAERIATRPGPVAADEESEGSGAAIHEEIDRLPERYRVPIVLCDLEGRTHEQAARHLGCPVGTVKSRLSRGRERLGERLKRRGLAIPTASPALALLPRAIRAGSTRWAAVPIAAGRPVAGAVPATVVALMGRVSGELLMKKIQAVAVTLVALAGVGGMAWNGFLAPAAGQESPRAEGSAVEAREAVGIEGKWEVVYLGGTADGRRQGFPTPNLMVPVEGGRINLPALTGRDDDPINYLGAMSYLLDPGGKAGEIDIEAGPGGKVLKGICQLRGDVLTICHDESPSSRPQTFAPRKASEGLIILRRVAERPAPAPVPGPVLPPTGPVALPGR